MVSHDTALRTIYPTAQATSLYYSQVPPSRWRSVYSYRGMDPPDQPSRHLTLGKCARVKSAEVPPLVYPPSPSMLPALRWWRVTLPSKALPARMLDRHTVLTECSHLPVFLHSQVVVAAEKVNKEIGVWGSFFCTQLKAKIK